MRTTLFEYPFHQTFCAAKLGKWPCDGNMSLFSTCWRGFWLHGMWTVGSPIMSPDDILTHRQDLVVTPKGTTYTDSSLYVYEMGTQRLLGLRPKGTQQFLQNKKNAGLHVSPIAWGLEYLECRTVAFKRCRPFPQAFRWWLILRMRMGMLFVSLLRMCFRSLPLRLLWFERHIVADATADKKRQNPWNITVRCLSTLLLAAVYNQSGLHDHEPRAEGPGNSRRAKCLSIIAMKGHLSGKPNPCLLPCCYPHVHPHASTYIHIHTAWHCAKLMIGTCLHHWEVAFFVGDPVPQTHELGTGVAGSRWAHLQDYKSLLPDSLFIFTKRHPAHSSLLQRSTGKQEIRCPQCCVAFCFATRFHGKVALHHQLGLCSKLYRRWRWVSSSKMSRKYIGTCINCMRIFSWIWAFEIFVGAVALSTTHSQHSQAFSCSSGNASCV